MKSKSFFWLIPIVIIALIAVLSFTNCFSSRVEVNTSEFDNIVFAEEISYVEVNTSEFDNIVFAEEISYTDKEGNPQTRGGPAKVAKEDLGKGSTIKKATADYEFDYVTINNVLFSGYTIEFDVELYSIGDDKPKATLEFGTNYSRDTKKIELIEAALLDAGITYSYTDEGGLAKVAKEDIDEGSPTIYKKATANCEFDYVTINNVLFSGYTIEFDVELYSIGDDKPKATLEFGTNYSRDTKKIELIEAALLDAGITYSYTDPNAGSIWSSLLPIGGSLLIAVVFFILIMQSQGGTKGAMNFAKTNARLNQNIKVRFTDVAGAEEEKEELKEVVDFLKNPKKFSELGARIPKGVLLVGPPGTGKTLFAKAVAGEAGVPFFSISGSDFVEMFVGVGASRVRDLFDNAKKSMPCIIFIDEIDAVGRQRGTGMGGGHDEREQTLNQLLVQMDGFETNGGIVVMAATNRADILDPALLRPGRFDRQIYVNVPDVRGREAILKVHARNKPLAPDVNFKTVARMTSGFSGADIENLLNEAAILAARANRRFITNKDLYEGINKVLLGPQKKSRLVTETDKRITAYHESGHAILARLLPNCDPVHEVSIIPRGQAAGYTMTRPDNDDNHLTKAKLLDDIVMTLGGRVAEELVIKDISAGASGDIQAVSKRARLMVTEWGMSDRVGPISYSSDKEIFIGRDMASHVTYSEETAGIIDEEVQKIITEALAKAREMLSKNRKLLDNMARLLVERETIFTEEVDMLMEGKSVEEIMAFMDDNESTLQENPFARKSAMIEKETKQEETLEEEPNEIKEEKIDDSKENEKEE